MTSKQPGARTGNHKHRTQPKSQQPRAYDDARYRVSVKWLRTWDHTCHRCGNDIDPKLRWPHPLSWSADHIIPVSLLPAGDYRLWHRAFLQAMHLRCNESRGNKNQQQTKPLHW